MYARKVATLLIGIVVVGCGVVMIVLPGPAFIVIPVGIGILAREFAWAKRVQDEFFIRLRVVRNWLRTHIHS